MCEKHSDVVVFFYLVRGQGCGCVRSFADPILFPDSVTENWDGWIFSGGCSIWYVFRNEKPNNYIWILFLKFIIIFIIITFFFTTVCTFTLLCELCSEKTRNYPASLEQVLAIFHDLSVLIFSFFYKGIPWVMAESSILHIPQPNSAKLGGPSDGSVGNGVVGDFSRITPFNSFHAGMFKMHVFLESKS